MATVKKLSNKKTPKLKSFQVSKSDAPFMTFKITEQTVYWTILLSLITILFIWVINIQFEAVRAISGV